MTTATETDTFVTHYASVWNESDPARRRELVAELWAEDAVQYTDTKEHHGHEALDVRVAGAYEQFVAPGEFVFVAAGDTLAHHDAITFTTHMVPVAGGDPVWAGLIVLLLGGDGRIVRDYQFARP